MAKKPNILFFAADQMRADSLHHLGNKASITPNIDALLNEGVSFENAYCQNPVCVPSRCSFLTGLYPHTMGHRTMHFLQRENEPNILREMKNNGYEVIWIGGNDIVPRNRVKTAYCDEYYEGIDFTNTRDVISDKSFGGLADHQPKVTEKMMNDGSLYSFYIGKIEKHDLTTQMDWNRVKIAIDYIERKSKEKNSKPFFLYCSLFFPHPPYACEDPWYSMIDRSKVPPRRPNIQTLKDKASMLYGINAKQHLDNWSEDRFTELRATYLAMVSRFDHQFGMIVDKLKETNQYEDTSIFVYSDHGDYTGDYSICEKVQNCFENPVSNIPLVVKPAKQFEVKPRVSKALVELVDLPATIAKMGGFDLSYTQFGKPLLETLAGNETHKDAVFCEGGRIHGEEQCMEKGHGPESPYYPRLATQGSEGPEHTKATMMRMGNIKYTMRLYEKDELYDLDQDPMELKNLIDEPEYQETVWKMKERLLQYFMETGDFVPMGRDQR